MSKSTATEREIFDRCLALSLQERSVYLQEVAAEDSSLAQRVIRLLEAHDRAEALSLSGLASMKDAPEAIGPYRLGRILGEGGMGVVYAAEQTFPVRRMVALKLVRRGMDSKQVISRFEAERQALAVMDHPNIARVLDAGSTRDGRPYFVMELVDGESLLSFCDRNELTIRERLELFLPLCDAVQHAHQKGVIHRDLKPSNVMVSRQDGQVRLKVIDFGIAKAVGPQPVERTLDTQLGTALGTPSYMSPEQAGKGGLDIDTRTDIYSLGIMLYEVLVGVPPLEAEGVGVHSLVAKLLSSDYEPPPPSVRFAGLAEEQGRIAAERRTTPASLKRELTGDLDWVVMKAIHRDREQRYQTANGLAMDLSRYLNDLPVVARPPSRSYQARKFIQRHRPLVAALGLAVLALLVGGIGLIAGLLRADLAREEALRQAEKATEAEQAAQERIRNALVAQARALRRGYSPGRRVESLALLTQASDIRPGDDLRDEAIAATSLTDIRLHARWAQSEGRGTALAFSPGFEIHAWGERGGRVEVHRGFTQQASLELASPGSDAWGLRFSPDGRYLGVKYHGTLPARDGQILIWDTDTGKTVFHPPGALGGLAMAFSPDGRLFA